MNIVSVSKDDASQLKKIARLAIENSVTLPDKQQLAVIESTYSHINDNLESIDCVFLKYESLTISGFILVQQYWNLSDLFVNPKEHGKGIGKSLLDEAIKACKANSSKSFIRVNSSLNAEAFYRNSGFISYDTKQTMPAFIKPLIYHF